MPKPSQNQINPNKLLLSKWTAAQPVKKQKHFLVTCLVRDEQELIVGCILEAVINKQEFELDWRVLKNPSDWLPGWR